MQTIFSIYSERLYWDDLRALPARPRANQAATAGPARLCRYCSPFRALVSARHALSKGHKKTN